MNRILGFCGVVAFSGALGACGGGGAGVNNLMNMGRNTSTPQTDVCTKQSESGACKIMQPVVVRQGDGTLVTLAVELYASNRGHFEIAVQRSEGDSCVDHILRAAPGAAKVSSSSQPQLAVFEFASMRKTVCSWETQQRLAAFTKRHAWTPEVIFQLAQASSQRWARVADVDLYSQMNGVLSLQEQLGSDTVALLGQNTTLMGTFPMWSLEKREVVGVVVPANLLNEDQLARAGTWNRIGPQAIPVVRTAMDQQHARTREQLQCLLNLELSKTQESGGETAEAMGARAVSDPLRSQAAIAAARSLRSGPQGDTRTCFANDPSLLIQ